MKNIFKALRDFAVGITLIGMIMVYGAMMLTGILVLELREYIEKARNK